MKMDKRIIIIVILFLILLVESIFAIKSFSSTNSNKNKNSNYISQNTIKEETEEELKETENSIEQEENKNNENEVEQQEEQLEENKEESSNNNENSNPPQQNEENNQSNNKPNSNNNNNNNSNNNNNNYNNQPSNPTNNENNTPSQPSNPNPIPTPTPTPTPIQTFNAIEVYFLDTQSDTHTTNESILLKTNTNKTILVDLGNDDQDIYNTIKNNINSIANNKIDYLIISHSHEDHTGNLIRILQDNSITINNIIYKNESLGNLLDKKTIKDVINSYKKLNTNIIETTSYNSESASIVIDENVKIKMYNLRDVFSPYSKETCSISDYSIKFSTIGIKENLKYNNQYIYIDIDETYSSTLKYDSNNTSSKFYAYPSKRSTKCNANTNSIALLFEVKTNNQNKYIYLPSDLENNGYSFFGNIDPVTNKKLYGNGITYFYENIYDKVNYNNVWTIDNNNFVSSNKSILVSAEYQTANNILNDIGKNNLNNLVIYQQSHHGFNNAKDAVDTLNLNRSNVYAIGTYKERKNTFKDALMYRSYYVTLSKTKRLTSGLNNGVYCYITNEGKYECLQK